jgi:hypothetical protein
MWADPTGHAIFMLVDATGGHAINRVLFDLGFFRWNTCTTRAVVTGAEWVALSARR